MRESLNMNNGAGGRHVTMEDVARACGLSKATVSYVLNNKRGMFQLSAATVRKVLEESRRLDYRPDQVARALAEQRKRALRVLVLSPWLHSQFSDFMVQVSHALEASADAVRADYRLYQRDGLANTLRPSLCRKYDAVIVLGTSRTDDAYLDRHRPLLANVALLNRQRDGYPCSHSNDEVATAEMARRLREAAHYRRFVLVHHAAISHREALRLQGYRDGFSGLPDGTLREWEYPMQSEGAPAALLECFGKEGVCYIFTQYLPAAALLTEALRQGLDVPRQLGIVGFDNHSLLQRFLRPSLTTIDPHIPEMTREVIRMAAVLKEGGRPESAVVPSSLVLGGTAILQKARPAVGKRKALKT